MTKLYQTLEIAPKAPSVLDRAAEVAEWVPTIGITLLVLSVAFVIWSEWRKASC